MPKIRVLVVDDSVVVRRMVTDALNADAEIEVAGIAPNGRIALAKIEELNPDVVTLDVEMPEMDGLQTLAAIRKTRPKLPVIMFSTMTSRGAAATLDALALGASDYVNKPANVGSVNEARQRLRDELIPKIRHFFHERPVLPKPAATVPRLYTAPAPRLATTRGLPPEVIVIGISTGGPNALCALIPALPATLRAPVLIVQHMPPVFTKLLAERLNAASALPVKEAEAGDILTAPGVWIAPGDYHLSMSRVRGSLVARLSKGPTENSCRPAVDVLFRSAAVECRGRVLAAVLTGMGQDGFRGSQEIHEAGGEILAQDEATSVVWGMPGCIARAGLASAVLPLGEIAGAIARRACVRPQFSERPPVIGAVR